MLVFGDVRPEVEKDIDAVFGWFDDVVAAVAVAVLLLLLLLVVVVVEVRFCRYSNRSSNQGS